MQIILFYGESNSWKRKSEVNIGFRLSFWFKTNWKMVSGVPESANQKWISLSGVPFCSKHFEYHFQEFLKAQITIEYRFQEFLKVLFFLNRTKRSSWKHKSLLNIGFRSSLKYKFFQTEPNGVPESANHYWISVSGVP